MVKKIRNILCAALFLPLLAACAAAGGDGVVTAPNAAFGNLELAPVREHVTYAAQPDEQTVGMFKDQGFDLVINLRDITEKIGFDERALVEGQGITYRHIPYLNVDEDRMINNDALMAVKNLLDDARAKNQKVLLHCSHGLRAASTIGLILYRDYGYSKEEAEDIAKSVGMRGQWIQNRFDDFVARYPQN